MKQILFVHSAGTQGTHEGSGDLIANLKAVLGSEYNIIVPMMPEPERPTYQAWSMKLREELEALSGEVLLAGHSLGGSVLLKFLSEHTVSNRISGLFVLAAPFWGKDSDWLSDEFELPERFPLRLMQIPHLYFYHSRDDAVVPFQHMQLYAEYLPHAAFRELDHFGHFFRVPCRQLIDDILAIK